MPIFRLQNTQKSLNLNSDYTYIYMFENGSKLYFIEGTSPSIQTLVYKDSNGNEIVDTTNFYLKDEELTHIWHNDKYINI